MKILALFLLSVTALTPQGIFGERKPDPPKSSFVSITRFHPDPGTAHLVANEFAEAVGRKLKTSYPSRVVNPKAEMRYIVAAGHPGFYLVYSCEIQPTTERLAEYYFDRRGTLLTDEDSAISETVRKTSEAMEQFKRLYGNAQPVGSSTATAQGRGRFNQTWYLQESFFTARK